VNEHCHRAEKAPEEVIEGFERYSAWTPYSLFKNVIGVSTLRREKAVIGVTKKIKNGYQPLAVSKQLCPLDGEVGEKLIKLNV